MPDALVLTHPTSPQQSPASQVKIYVRQAWDDTWTLLSGERLEYVTFACAPAVSRAQFSRRYGKGLAPGDATFQTYAPLAVGRYLCKVTIAYESAPDTYTIGHTWHGQIEISGSKADGYAAGVVSGDQSIAAYGHEIALDRHRIHRSAFRYKNDFTQVDTQGSENVQTQGGEGLVLQNPQQTVDYGITFNKGGKGNRTATKPPLPLGDGDIAGSWHEFCYDASGAYKWSTKDIVEYLIKAYDNNGDKFGVPDFTAGLATPWAWGIDTADLNRLPDWDAPEIDTHLISVKQILDALISRRRFYTWYLEVDEATYSVKLRIRTFAESELSLGTIGSIPANSDQFTLEIEDSIGSTVVEQTDTSHAVDQVVVYGAKQTATFSTRLSRDGVSYRPAYFPNLQYPPILREGWTIAEQVAYTVGGSTDPNYPSDDFKVAEQQRYMKEARDKEELKHVFSRFSLVPDSMRFMANIGVPPVFYDDATILPTIPLYENVDYSGDKILNDEVEGPTGGVNRTYRHPMVVFQVNEPYEYEPGTVIATERFVRADRLGRTSGIEPPDEVDIRDWETDLRVEKNGKSLRISLYGAPRSTIAGDSFTPTVDVDPETEKIHGVWNYVDALATIAIAPGGYCESRYPADVDVTTDSTKRVMRIPAGDSYRVDWVDGSTIVDVTAEGALVTVDSAAFVRDDRDKMAGIARQAHYWYSRERNSFRIRTNYDEVPAAISVGRLFYQLVEANEGVNKDVKALVTEVHIEARHELGKEPAKNAGLLTMSINTAFGELDFLRLKDEKT